MLTKTYQVYKFNELPEEAKEKAIERLYDINIDYEWWQYIYEDAKRIGLEITSFDLDRNRQAEGNLIEYPYKVIELIKKEHGECCDTYKFAQRWKKDLKEDQNLDNEQEFLDELLEEYSMMLQKEYEYLTSNEAIIETIEANDYDFTLDGKID